MKKRWLVVEAPTFMCSLPLQQGTTTVGKSSDCDIVLRGGPVSRRHARFELHGAELTVKDLESSARTLVNGEAVTEAHLVAGDRVTIAGASLLVAEEPLAPAKGDAASVGAAQSPSGWGAFAAFIERLRSFKDPRDLLQRLLLGLVDVVGAERGFVLLQNENDELVTVATHCVEDTEEFIAISRTVYQRALDEQGVIFIADTTQDVWYLECSNLTIARPRAILCGALSADDETFGVVYVDGAPPISDGRRDLFTNVTALAAELLGAARTRKRLLVARSKIASLQTVAWEGDRFLLGTDQTEHAIDELISQAAGQDVTVLVTGETGTGKEMVARALHRLSPRQTGPFMAVDCAALSGDIIEAELFGAEKGAFTGATERRLGRFELAKGGTLFLDELGELPLDLQAKLLRVLQERRLTRLGGTQPVELDFRLICATNRDLVEEVREGGFRQDLFYRINVFTIVVPPLRERPTAIEVIADYFLERFSAKFARAFEGFTDDALKLLRSHSWPGNVRELRNAIERAVLIETSSKIRSSSLPLRAAAIAAPSSAVPSICEELPREFRAAKECFERSFFERSLRVNRHNISAVARETGLTRRTIYTKLSQLGLDEDGDM